MTPSDPPDRPSADDGPRSSPPDELTRPLPDGSTPTGSVGPASGASLSAIFDLEPVAPAAPDPLLRTIIGDARIVRFIGQGGMGRVYEGYQAQLGRAVAVKVMRPGLVATPGMQKRFDHEAKILAQLRHPGIAQVYATGVQIVAGAPVPYFVMEFIPGARTLTRYAEDLKLPTRARLDLFRSVCDAVAHGHAQGVIHRDLKPGNILVSTGGQPKVIDFGVAKATDSDLALTTMQTDVGQIIGTLQYMGPEQMQGDPNMIDVRCDVYALGVVLYELLTGKLPYDVRRKAVFEAMRIVREDEPTPISVFDKTLQRDVAVIAGKCLEKDRSRRYASASDLGDDVARHLAGEPIAAAPPHFIDGVSRLARRHRAAAAATIGIFATLVAAVVCIGVFAGNAEVARRRADSERLAADKARVIAEAAESVARHEKDIAAARLYEANLYRIDQLLKEREYAEAREIFADAASNFLKGKPLPIELTYIDAYLNQSLVAYEGHRGNVWRVAFSPDGATLFTGSSDGTIRLWDAKTDHLLAVLNSCGEIAVSPDGGRLATSSADETRRLWDARTGKQLNVFGGRDGSINSIVFSPDGHTLATTEWDPDRQVPGTTARLWDTRTDTLLAVLEGHDDSICYLAFSPDGARLATGSSDGTTRLWDTAAGKLLSVLEGGDDVAFSPDGARLVTRTSGNTVRLWNTKTDKLLAVLESCHEIAFSPDGARLATTEWDSETGSTSTRKSARLWDATTGNLLAVLVGHDDSISSLAFSRDGTRIATGSQDKTVRLWDVNTGKQLTALQVHGDSVHSLTFSPDGTRLATTDWDSTDTSNVFLSQEATRLWDTNTGDMLAEIKTTAEPVFSPDGTRLATGSRDKTVRLWDVNTGKQLAAFEGHGDSVSSLAFSPDGTRLLSGSRDGTVRLWEADATMHLAALDGMRCRLAFSPDGTKFAAIAKNTVWLWDAITYKPLAMLEGQDDFIESLAFSPDGTRLALKSKRNAARLWDATTGKPLAVFEGAPEIVFSPDGSRFVTFFRQLPRQNERLQDGRSYHARLWDAKTVEQVTVLTELTEPTKDDYNGRTSVAFSKDGALFTTTSDSATDKSHTIRLWHAYTGKLLATLDGVVDNKCFRAHAPDQIAAHLWGADTGKPLELAQGMTRGATFSPDGNKFITSSADGTVRLWNSKTDKPLAVLGLWYTVGKFSPDGTRVAAETERGTVRIWSADTGQLLCVLKGHEGEIVKLVFSPDGSRLASTCYTTRQAEKVRLWDATSGKLLGVQEGDRHGRIYSCLYSPDSKRLATTSIPKRSTQIWDATNGRLLASLEGVGLAFSADGSRLEACSAKGFAHILGVSNAHIHRARLQSHSVERLLDGTVSQWLQGGPDAAVAKLHAAKATMTPDEYRVAGNMILSRCCNDPADASTAPTVKRSDASQRPAE